jgi:hypothetical protein
VVQLSATSPPPARSRRAARASTSEASLTCQGRGTVGGSGLLNGSAKGLLQGARQGWRGWLGVGLVLIKTAGRGCRAAFWRVASAAPSRPPNRRRPPQTPPSSSRWLPGRGPGWRRRRAGGPAAGQRGCSELTGAARESGRRVGVGVQVLTAFVTFGATAAGLGGLAQKGAGGDAVCGRGGGVVGAPAPSP